MVNFPGVREKLKNEERTGAVPLSFHPPLYRGDEPQEGQRHLSPVFPNYRCRTATVLLLLVTFRCRCRLTPRVRHNPTADSLP